MERITETKGMNAEDAKRKYGAIRVNQVWEKRDTKRQMVVIGTGKNGLFRVQFLSGGNLKKSHHLKQKDIYRYYDKIS